MTRSDVRFLTIVAVLFLAGAGLRWRESRLAAAQAARPVAAPAYGASTRAPTLSGPTFTPIVTTPPGGATGAEAAVLTFYDSINRGRYDEAYGLALESRWRKTATLTYQLDGSTSREAFVKALQSELVYEGFVITVHTIQTLGASALPAAQQDPKARRELWALTSLAPGVEVDGIYQVPVQGTVLMACTKWDFSRRVSVAHLKGDGGWLVLLPGPLEPTANHYDEWFRNSVR